MTRYCYPDTIQCSTPPKLTTPLYLYIFRGEPAISGLDKHITSNHKSSEPFEPDNGTGLASIFIEGHPAHG